MLIVVPLECLSSGVILLLMVERRTSGQSQTAMFLGAINEMRIDLVTNRITSLNAKYTRIKDRKVPFTTDPEKDVESNRRLNRLDARITTLYKRRNELIEKHRKLYTVK